MRTRPLSLSVKAHATAVQFNRGASARAVSIGASSQVQPAPFALGTSIPTAVQFPAGAMARAFEVATVSRCPCGPGAPVAGPPGAAGADPGRRPPVSAGETRRLSLSVKAHATAVQFNRGASARAVSIGASSQVQPAPFALGTSIPTAVHFPAGAVARAFAVAPIVSRRSGGPDAHRTG